MKVNKVANIFKVELDKTKTLASANQLSTVMMSDSEHIPYSGWLSLPLLWMNREMRNDPPLANHNPKFVWFY